MVPSAVPDVRVLGPVEVIGPTGAAQLVGVRQRAVVGLLALRVGTVVHRWRLVDALWGDAPPRTAVKSLHSYVARVRQALEACGLPDVVVTRESGYALMLPADAVDAWRFEDLARLGAAELTTAAARAADHLREGLALWRSEVALADAEPTGWGAAEVERLTEVRLTAVEDLWTAELRLGRHAAAVGELERLLVAHPLRERMVGLLMLARYRCGQQAEALDAYQRLRARLAEELGVDPGPELAALHTRILRREPDLDPSEPMARATTAMPVPAQLPARVGHFAGRSRELTTLDRLLATGPDAGIAVISGPAGVGKTALALQWAHAVADRFPDGQLFLDLRGHDAQAALVPAEALAHLLRSLGVPGDRIPADPAECAGLYRSLMSGKRILVVLDNAPAADGIVPLIPASPSNLVVVTGRNSMTALATRHAVLPIVLDVLTDGEAVDLLANVLGRDPVADDPDAAAEVARLCGGLPLALRIAAAKLVGHPERRIRDVVTELAGANRLDVLAVDGDSRSVRTVLASAYQALSRPAARVFRLLGLHPGPTFSGPVAAALTGIPVSAATAAVTELAAVHLAIPAARDRYRCHDLVRLFARQCAELDESPTHRTDASALLVDWYLAAVGAACQVIEPGRDRVTVPPPRSPELLPFAAEHHAALDFLDGERDNLLPIVRYAADHGHETVAWQLTYLLTGFYDSRGHWRERVEMCRIAVGAADRLGDPAARGLMHSALGVARIMTREFQAALGSLSEALSLMRACGDQRGEGHVLNNMAAAYSRLRRFDDAVDAFRQALALHTASGHRLGVALALNNTGHTYVRMGRPEGGIGDLTAALEISREIANPRLEAAVLHSLGEAALLRGEAAEALDHLGRALEVHRLIGDRQYEAETLDGLGLAYLRQGKLAEAFDHLFRALALARDIADPHQEAIVQANLGQAYLEEGSLEVAAEHLGLALTLRARVPDPHEEAKVHRVLAELERRAGAERRAGRPNPVP